MDLKTLREYLDILDRSLIYILAQRMSIIPLIAEYKIQNSLPIRQPQREEEMFEEMRGFSEKVGLNPELLVNIYKLIIEDAVRIQQDMFNKRTKGTEKEQDAETYESQMPSMEESLNKLKEFIGIIETKQLKA